MTITLATLPTATEQEVYDQVVEHLRKQNARSFRYFGEKHACAYRNGKGLKCAAGCLISDEEYNERMEMRPWETLVAYRVVPPKHANLIRHLQNLHDTTATTTWEDQFKKLAETFHLEYKRPTQ